MAVKGSSEVIKSPAEQNAIRRAAKANRKHRKGGRPTETMTQGLRDDMRTRQIERATEVLEKHMVSSAPSVQKELREAGTEYADVYFTAAGPHKERHKRALRVALEYVSNKGARGYAARVLAAVHREVNPRKLRNS